MGEALRELGEDLAPSLCNLLAISQHQNIKIQIIEFFRAQIRIYRATNKENIYQMLDYGIFLDTNLLKDLFNNIMLLLRNEKNTVKRTPTKYFASHTKEDSILTLDLFTFKLCDFAADLFYIIHLQKDKLEYSNIIVKKEQDSNSPPKKKTKNRSFN